MQGGDKEMKKRYLIGLIALIPMLMLTGCGKGNAKQQKVQAEMTRYASTSGKSVLSSQSFNTKKNTEDIKLKPSIAKKVDLANRLNQALNTKNKKLQNRAKVLIRKHYSDVNVSRMAISGLDSQIHKAYSDSRDKNMRIKITNPTKKFPTKPEEQAELQPNRKIAKQQLNHLQTKAKWQEIGIMKKMQQKQLNKAKGKLNKQNVPAYEKQQAINKWNSEIKQQDQKQEKKLHLIK